MRLILVMYAAPLASLAVLACLVFLGEMALWAQKVREARKVSQVLQERTASMAPMVLTGPMVLTAQTAAMAPMASTGQRA